MDSTTMKQRYDGSIYIPVQAPVALESTAKPNLTLVPDRVGKAASGDLQWLQTGPLELEHGGRLEEVTIAYRTWGQLNDARDNAVLLKDFLQHHHSVVQDRNLVCERQHRPRDVVDMARFEDFGDGSVEAFGINSAHGLRPCTMCG